MRSVCLLSKTLWKTLAYLHWRNRCDTLVEVNFICWHLFRYFLFVLSICNNAFYRICVSAWIWTVNWGFHNWGCHIKGLLSVVIKIDKWRFRLRFAIPSILIKTFYEFAGLGREVKQLVLIFKLLPQSVISWVVIIVSWCLWLVCSNSHLCNFNLHVVADHCYVRLYLHFKVE